MDAQIHSLDKESLLRRIEDVRQEITSALLEIDQILLQANPQIEADYAVKIGCLENELLQAQIAARRAKRRLALAQARVNRGEAVSAEALDAVLDEEFAAWEAQLAVQVEDYLAKLEARTKSRVLSPVEAKELRRLHKELVKRLHPDLHPGQTDEEARLFSIAQGAFKKGDLDTLRSIEVTTSYLASDGPDASETEDALYTEHELLCAQLRITQEQLAACKARPPYTLREKLASPEWVHRRTEELKAQIAEQKEAKQVYDSKYDTLVAHCGYGKEGNGEG